MQDSEAYSILLHQLQPTIPLISGAVEATPERASRAIANARSLGAPTFIQPKDIVDGNKKLNMIFVAQIFNECHGLTITEVYTVSDKFLWYVYP